MFFFLLLLIIYSQNNECEKHNMVASLKIIIPGHNAHAVADFKGTQGWLKIYDFFKKI